MGIIKIKQNDSMPCSKLTSSKFGDSYTTLNSIPIGLYKGNDGRTYAVLFATVDYNEGSYFLTSDRGFTNAHEKHDSYILKYDGWSHGLTRDSTIRQVFNWVEKVVPRHHLSDPVLSSRYICAYISKKVNHNRLIQGCWGEDVSFAKSLVDIFEDYENGETSYAQCFVFSATLCGLLRHVGIPCRQVICTNAGHVGNTEQQQLTMIQDEEGNKHGDSIWNYHCWCEAWIYMNNNAEWCVIDATPQEPSVSEPLKGYYVCGPCPISAMNNVYNITDKHNYFDLKFISVNVRGVVSNGVEYEDKHMRIFYYRNYDGTGTDIYTEDRNGNWIDVKSRYHPTSDFPYGTYDYSMNISRDVVTLSGDVPSNVEVYLLLIESRHSHSGPIAAKSIESYEVIPLNKIGNNEWKYSERYCSGWSHKFIVAGVKTKVRYTHTSVLGHWISTQI